MNGGMMNAPPPPPPQHQMPPQQQQQPQSPYAGVHHHHPHQHPSSIQRSGSHSPSGSMVGSTASRSAHSLRGMSMDPRHHHPEYLHMPQQQQQQQYSSSQPQHLAPNSGAANNSNAGGNGAPRNASSLPWTVGSTDGTFATMTLIQQQQQEEQQQQQQQQQQTSGGNGGGAGAAIGSKGEATSHAAALAAIQGGRSLYHDRLFRQPSASVESVLAASCEVMGFDIAEMWLRTGPKTHQLTNSHLRPTALEDSVRKELVDVYYGEKSNERTHRLSPALCKRAKDANDVVWVTAHTAHGAEALRCSISNVRTAVAVPVCHESSNTNVTIIYFSIRRIIMKPAAVEFLVHLSLSAAVSSVTNLAEDGLVDRTTSAAEVASSDGTLPTPAISQSEHVPRPKNESSTAIHYHRVEKTSVTGAPLDLQWRQLSNVEYLTDGGNSWIHTAVFNDKPVVVKTLKPECQDVVVAINEIEEELAIHARLNHPNIVHLIGAGSTSKGVRFVVLERLDGGTLTQMLGYDTRIRDRRRRFWRKKQFAYLDVLRYARSIAAAMKYCHEDAIPGSMVLHRDLKPDNIGFTLNGSVKLLDFGLAKVLDNVNPSSADVYQMSGETGSLRYMAPEVADGLPYNQKADVYSFGIILWEMNATKKPFEGLTRDEFYERVVHGGERPLCNKKWPEELSTLMQDCWASDITRRPNFVEVVERIDELLSSEKGGGSGKNKSTFRRISGMIDRHSTWF